MLRFCSTRLGALTATTAVALALSQAAPARAAEEPNQLAEVVVTAQKRGQNLQSVPMAITAVTSETLEDIGAHDMRDLTSVTSGLVFTKSVANGIPFIRGVGQTLGDISAESPTSVYVDGVYMMHPASGLFSLGGVERIEVLKGPQGTLFGRNATGGLIHLVMKTPRPGASEGEVRVGYGSYDTSEAAAYGSFGLSDSLATNMSVYFRNRDKGYIKTLAPGVRLGATTNISLMNKWVWDASDKTRITLGLLSDYSKDDVGTRFGTPEGSVPVASGVPFMGFYTLPGTHPDGRNPRQNLTGYLTAEHDLGWAILKNQLAYNYVKAKVNFETIIPGVGLLPNSPIYARLVESADTITNELQLQAPAGSDFQWIAGLYFLSDIGSTDRVSASTLSNWIARRYIQDLQGRQKTMSYAAFAQATKTVLPAIRLTVGVRYTEDEKEVTGVAPIGPFRTFEAGLASVNAKPKSSWSKVTWRVALDHDLTESVMLYAGASEGFKSGVYNVGTFNNPPVSPEVVRLYEAGAKTELFDRRVRLNASVFLQNYDDIQLRSPTIILCGPSGCSPAAVLFNAATSRMKGIDLDFQTASFGGFSFSGNLTYLDAKFRSFPLAPCIVPNRNPAGALSGGSTTIACDLSGKRMPRAPEWTANIGVNYTYEFGNGSRAAFSISDAYNSGFGWDPDVILKQDPYHLVSGSIAWFSDGDVWSARIWGRNLLEEHIWANGAGGTNSLYYPDEPRTFGVSVTRTF